MLDILIKNITIVDGSGSEPFIGNVGIKEGKINVNPILKDANKIIDGTGKTLTPGFIDAHSHGDLVMGQEVGRICKTNQGVTTDIIGQCGLSLTPINPSTMSLIQGVLSLGTASFPEEMRTFTSFKKYLKWADNVPKTCNSKVLIGHSTLRVAVMGFDDRESTPEELERMKELLREAMENGAMGMSTGLIYTPSCYATKNEIIELAKILKDYDGIYTSHIRNESYDSLKAIEEIINIAKVADIPVVISHHKICGKANWGLQKETLKLIQSAVDEGLEITCDQYPYTKNMTHISACIPPWHLSKGIEEMSKSFADKEKRMEIRKEMESADTQYDNYYLNAGGWDGVFVSSAERTPEVEGKYISEYAEEIGKDPFDAFFDLMIANKGEVGAVYSSMCDEDVFDIATAPNTIVGSDGLARSLSPKGHPRAFASFPHAICYYAKDNNIMTLQEVIRRMTSMTAERLRVRNKGLIKDGYDADIVIFDYAELRDRANYVECNLLTDGIEFVIVNGQIVYKDKELTGVAPAKIIRHNENK